MRCVRARGHRWSQQLGWYGESLGVHGLVLIALMVTLAGAASAATPPTLSEEEMAAAEFIYFDRCSGCHGALRKGATGPNIADEAMLKKSLSELEQTIFEGTDAGMPGWGRTGELTAEESALMARFDPSRPTSTDPVDPLSPSSTRTMILPGPSSRKLMVAVMLSRCRLSPSAHTQMSRVTSVCHARPRRWARTRPSSSG